MDGSQSLDLKMVVEFAPEQMVDFKPVKSYWRGNVLHLKVDPGFDETRVRGFLLEGRYGEVDVRGTSARKREPLDLKLRRNPLEYDRKRSYDTKDDTGDFSYLQYLQLDNYEYRVGSIDFVAPLCSGARTTVVADIVPPNGELQTPPKDWFKMSGAAQERIYISKEEFPEDPDAFWLIYWKHVYNKEAGVYEYINGQGDKRLKHC